MRFLIFLNSDQAEEVFNEMSLITLPPHFYNRRRHTPGWTLHVASLRQIRLLGKLKPSNPEITRPIHSTESLISSKATKLSQSKVASIWSILSADIEEYRRAWTNLWEVDRRVPCGIKDISIKWWSFSEKHRYHQLTLHNSGCALVIYICYDLTQSNNHKK